MAADIVSRRPQTIETLQTHSFYLESQLLDISLRLLKKSLYVFVHVMGSADQTQSQPPELTRWGPYHSGRESVAYADMQWAKQVYVRCLDRPPMRQRSRKIQNSNDYGSKPQRKRPTIT